MEEEEGGGGGFETLVLQKVAEVSSTFAGAKRADDVICALHSLAALLFRVDSSLVLGAVDERCRSQIINVTCLTDAERRCWVHAFYHGSAFPTLARILVSDVASKWLRHFPTSATKHVYDSFFVEGPSTEIVQALVPALNIKGSNKDLDLEAIYSNLERLLILCLFKNEGIQRMVGEFGFLSKNNDDILKPDQRMFISKIAQLLASIPDKARLGSSSALSSSLFFKRVASQLLVGAEERALVLTSKKDATDQQDVLDPGFLFVGEAFSRVCRRGSTDILVAELITRIRDHIGRCSRDVSEFTPDVIESDSRFHFWVHIIEVIKDQYSIERLTEEMLRQLASQNTTDIEAYWILWVLFNRSFKLVTAMRAMFVDKFLLWKIFPLCCLRWILQYSVFECPPRLAAKAEGQKTREFLNIVQRLVSIWRRREFVQSSSLEQQAYLTAAVGLCLEKMSKKDLEATADVLPSILEGVSGRLESPIDLVRKMASAVALMFSKIVDPKNPLYLDDDASETVDWEFGILALRKEIAATSHNNGGRHKPKVPLFRNKSNATDEKMQNVVEHGISFVDSDGLNGSVEAVHRSDDEEGNESDTSLEPYDLADDDTDLQKKFSHLGDIATALRKPDDPDGVEKALDVMEKLVRASPDELRYHSGDLIRALIHVRCSDVAIEGEEDSAEVKRQKALVALLVTCPFESLDVLTKSLYSASVDVGQRILIIDVMTEAAQELANTKIIHEQRPRNLISSTSQPWFMPSSRGPPGAGPWKEISGPGALSWSHRYEREIPSRPGKVKSGKSRKWGLEKSKDLQVERSQNRFPLYAAGFMLPSMQGFDKKRHGVDLLNRDFVVLGKLIYMLGVCMKCIAMHPEASALAPSFVDMIRSRNVSHHAEAYVRRSVIFAASCILVALHPSYVASALIEGNQEISGGLEWIRTWAFHVAEADSDTECASMAMTCLQLHSEMILQTSRALEAAERSKAETKALPPRLDNIILPFSNIKY